MPIFRNLIKAGSALSVAAAMLIGLALPASAATGQVGDGKLVGKGDAAEIPITIICEHDITIDSVETTAPYFLEIIQKVNGKTTTRAVGSGVVICNGTAPQSLTVTATTDGANGATVAGFKKGVSFYRLRLIEFSELFSQGFFTEVSGEIRLR